MANFADADDLVARYDVGLVIDLLSSSDSPSVVPSDIGGGVMAMALATATGRIKSAFRAGSRYTEADLEGLQDVASDLYNAESAAFLTDLCCQIAFSILWRRKPWDDTRESARKQDESDWREVIKSIRNGEMILNVGGDKSTPKSTGVTSTSAKYFWSQAPRGRFYPNRRLYG